MWLVALPGHEEALQLELAIESLAIRGRHIPHHIVFYYGAGGNSKGARSTLRATTFGAGHQWISPSVFDAKLKEEFRKQGTDFHGALFCTLREADSFELDEKMFKSWTAGESLACRLPHGIHTQMLSWPTTGKFWEINTQATPRIKSVTEDSFARRIRAVEKTATFTADPTKVNAKKKVFLADGKLEEKSQSPYSVWCYLRKVLLPWQVDHTEEEARDIIMKPSDAIRRDTAKFLRILRQNQEGGGDTNEAVAPVRMDITGGANDAVTDLLACEEFTVLRAAHEYYQTKSAIREWHIQEAACVPGTRWKSKKGGKTRVQRFDELIESPYNFFWKKGADGSYVRAPYLTIEPLLKLPHTKFGGPLMWRPFCSQMQDPVLEAAHEQQGLNDVQALTAPGLG